MAGLNLNKAERWPSLPLDEWKDTCDTLHLWTQVVGKVKLKLCPPMNELWQVALHPTVRGLASGRIPYGSGGFDMSFDFIEHALVITTSRGETRSVPLAARSVADFYRTTMGALRDLGIDVAVRVLPDEVPNAIPLDQDETHASYDRAHVRRWWQITLQVSLLLDRYRSSFAGKSSPVLFWWGSFDVNAVRFSGRLAPPMVGAPKFMRLAEDQENACTGFWPGNATANGLQLGEPYFYAYSYPEPAGFKEAPVRPEGARYDSAVGELLLPYETARQAPDPEATILEFFNGAFESSARLADWDSVAPINRRESA